MEIEGLHVVESARCPPERIYVGTARDFGMLCAHLGGGEQVLVAPPGKTEEELRAAARRLGGIRNLE